MITDPNGKPLYTSEIVRRKQSELNRARWGFVIWTLVLCAIMFVTERVRASELDLYTSHGWRCLPEPCSKCNGWHLGRVGR